MVRRWPDIDWLAFAAVVDEVLRTLSALRVSSRDLSYMHRVGISTLSRARHGVPIGAANFLAVCALFRLDPYTFLLNRPPDLPAQIQSEILEVSQQTLAETLSETNGRACR